MSSIFRPNLLAQVVVLVAALISVTVTGFQFGINNNVFHIPYVLQYGDLPIFHDDAFYKSLGKFTSLIWPILRLVSNEGNAEQVFFISHFVSRLVAFVALYWFFKVNGVVRHSTLLLALTATAVCPWVLNGSDVGGHGLFLRYFTHSEATWGPLIASLVAAQIGRLRLAAAFAGLAFLINAFVGIWLVLILTATVVGNANQRKDRTLLVRSTLIFLLVCAPVVIWIALAIKGKTAVPDFSYIEYIRAYYPGHFLIESTPVYALRNLAIVAYCGFIAAYIGHHRRFWFIVLSTLIALLAIGAVLPYILNNRFVFNLHLLRSAGVLQFLAVILSVSASICVIMEAKNSPSMRVISVLALGSLITFRPEPMSLLFSAVSLTFLAFIKLRGTESRLTGVFARISSEQTNYLAALLVLAAITANLLFVGVSVSAISRWVLILSIMFLVIRIRDPMGIISSPLLIIWAVLAALVVITSVKWRNSDSSEKSIKQNAERSEMMQWVRESQLSGTFLFPIHSPYGVFDDFQLRTKKPVWVDWKQGAAVMWEPSFYWQWMSRFEEVNSLRTKDEFAGYATRKGVPYLVLPRAIGECTPDFDALFSNSGYSICVVGNNNVANIESGPGR
jgi:hypothetical protein